MNKKKYGYLGPEGTYTEEALCVYLGNARSDKVPYPSIESVLEAVASGQITHGIVPLENSIEGTINITLDIIACNPQLNITGEVILPIRHNIMVKQETVNEDIKTIVSHPQALAQCRNYFAKYFPKAKFEEVNSTAKAAQMVARGGKELAAVGNEKAASRYGLVIMDQDIQDCKKNFTRFIIVSTDEEDSSCEAKTSIVISVTDRPGALYQILREFALANINLTKIESRPAKKNMGDYLFFIDIWGSKNESSVKKCLKAIEELSVSFRILGSYPPSKNFDKSTIHFSKNPTILEEIRQDIDIIDHQIVELLAKRTQLVSVVGRLKKNSECIKDERREQEILKRVKNSALDKGVSPELIERLYKVIFDHFVEFQKKQKA